VEELGKKMKIEMDSNSNYGHLREAQSLQGTSRGLGSPIKDSHQYSFSYLPSPFYGIL